MSNINEKTFADLRPYFYRYMVTFGELIPRTAKDYISRLSFLAEHHNIDDTLTLEKIEIILAQEIENQSTRSKYTYKKSY